MKVQVIITMWLTGVVSNWGGRTVENYEGESNVYDEFRVHVDKNEYVVNNEMIVNKWNLWDKIKYRGYNKWR